MKDEHFRFHLNTCENWDELEAYLEENEKPMNKKLRYFGRKQSITTFPRKEFAKRDQPVDKVVAESTGRSISDGMRKVLSISAKVKNQEDNRPRIELVYGDNIVNALLDTGATVSVIKKAVAVQLDAPIQKEAGEIKGLKGGRQIVGRCYLNIKKKGEKQPKGFNFLVVEDMEESMLLGIEEIRRLNLFSYLAQKKQKDKITNKNIVMEAKFENEVIESCTDIQELLEDIDCDEDNTKQEFKDLISEFGGV
ncbi:pol polyprotein [Vairimorpha necatrix]|uniref:Pol polyprotein n=1 Tax=Vairimorpha necatrix TaxID=6039 RepID=A0AAX4JDJ9_9MICR